MGRFVSLVGQTFNNIMIMKELREGFVLAQCMSCNSVGKYKKSLVVAGKTKCSRCENKSYTG